MLLHSVKLYLSTYWILRIQYGGSIKVEPLVTTFNLSNLIQKRLLEN
jgi:hypothetical protein